MVVATPFRKTWTRHSQKGKKICIYKKEFLLTGSLSPEFIYLAQKSWAAKLLSCFFKEKSKPWRATMLLTYQRLRNALLMLTTLKDRQIVVSIRQTISGCKSLFKLACNALGSKFCVSEIRFLKNHERPRPMHFCPSHNCSFQGSQQRSEVLAFLECLIE